MQVVLCINSLFLFIGEQDSKVCMDHSLLNHRLLIIKNKATMNIHIQFFVHLQVFVWTYIFIFMA